VEGTALELEEDLGGGLRELHEPLPARLSPDLEERLDALAQRVESLEHALARRERAFNRLVEFLSELSGSRR
jgi:hypothetical protein